MNLKVVIPILIGVVVVIGTSIAVLSVPSPPSEIKDYDVDFTYSDINKIKKILTTQNISMSTPTEISDRTVKQYCSYFDNDGVQKTVEYCSTTALVDTEDIPLGNINIGGSSTYASMALAIIDVSPQINSKSDEVIFVFQSMIDVLVCDCWEEKQPGGFESVAHWLEMAETRYLESDKSTLTSKIDGLDGKRVILEITSVAEESYIWTLVVVK